MSFSLNTWQRGLVGGGRQIEVLRIEEGTNKDVEEGD